MTTTNFPFLDIYDLNTTSLTVLSASTFQTFLVYKEKSELKQKNLDSCLDHEEQDAQNTPLKSKKKKKCGSVVIFTCSVTEHDNILSSSQ